MTSPSRAELWTAALPTNLLSCRAAEGSRSQLLLYRPLAEDSRMQAGTMDAAAMTARVQHTWNGAQPAYAVLVDDRVQAPANGEFIAAIRAHLAASGASESGENVHDRRRVLPPWTAIRDTMCVTC